MRRKKHEKKKQIKIIPNNNEGKRMLNSQRGFKKSVYKNPAKRYSLY